MTDALTLTDLHFGYGKRPAVRGVTLRIAPGDCYGFLGHNGAGKTTVMRCVLGLLRPSRGSVRVFGVDPAERRRAANALLGALIERPGFRSGARAHEHLRMLALLQGMPKRLAQAETERVLETVDLSEHGNRRIGTFSMGMRQRLGIAQALLGRPRLLLLDEPGNGLDPEGIADLRELLMRLTREDGTTVLLSSHQLAELDGLCTRVGVLREGAMVVEGDLETLRQHTGLRHVATGPSPEALQRELANLEIETRRDGDRLFATLGERSPHEVVRTLAAKTDLSSFAPEQATLERIYLQADRAASATGSPTTAASPSDATAQSAAASSPVSPLGRVGRPRLRTFAHEWRKLAQRRSSWLLLAIPTIVAVGTVQRYGGGVAEGQRLVEAGEQFSADAGSGYLAMAQAMQNGMPVLAACLLWIGSQIFASELSNDTLRNTLVRSVRRSDVLIGKLSLLLGTTALAWLVLVAATAAISGSWFGFGDLEEVTRYGDREVLCSAADVSPLMWLAICQLLLPLAAISMIGGAASALARHPALAVVFGALLVLLPELLRGSLGEDAGWLLTSHLPSPLRDDSILSYLSSTARGAADAVWVWAEQAAWAPLLWCAAAATTTYFVFLRMRIR